MWNPAMPLAAGKSLGEQAYETIRDAIITLELAPGTLIYENEMAEQLGISRTPVRDAFNRLIAEQLVDVLPQRNRRVAYLSEDKVRESGFVRLSLESRAFRAVAGRWDGSEPFRRAEREIGLLLEQQAEAAREQDAVRFLRLDEAFHVCILGLAGNRTLLDVVGQMRGHLNRVRLLAMKELEQTANLVQEHAELFERLRTGDAEAVGRLLEAHLGKLEEELPAIKEKCPEMFRN
ncbi:GntR family transcriptional regulator [Paenibacillus sp. J31TS4]|uniref:GntR family transcriptional regulator n=1 Tax=Paenibacillus sp. J31TS4 TaxID=2807195 RepID=UPI001B0BB641|nr:GntR family transcriptional regulator [Paenibacillus sp. J31TS4]GIP40070.1 GntR family transcriptional regulator [Paenibacillus sp. J31TS4]